MGMPKLAIEQAIRTAKRATSKGKANPMACIKGLAQICKLDEKKRRYRAFFIARAF